MNKYEDLKKSITEIIYKESLNYEIDSTEQNVCENILTQVREQFKRIERSSVND